ncbi:hypothetical protein EV385_2114 [Krasilnikovia cinnamomea]|uniref:Uncharacterized protein n=1 Tax=Krasilnikovia cinnamomea TaxID=349313 RepID=A0A4Q7ZJD0_9ACTN|nr:hypothetical protein [Krasilnikovia cinnamomea]RZU50345.1 hypothetical protein EV385_2114 [Krasilnikovia cinnamomea]
MKLSDVLSDAAPWAVAVVLLGGLGIAFIVLADAKHAKALGIEKSEHLPATTRIFEVERGSRLERTRA